MTEDKVENPAVSKKREARRWPRTVLRIARAAVVAYLVVILLMVIFENSLVYFPDRHPIGDWRPAGLEFEDAEFQADDGTRLHGWYIPHENPRAVVLFAHGNAGNLTHRADMLRRLEREVGVSVMIFDYRGYGKSEGSPSEAGILSDARAARAWLARRAGVAPTDIVLLGRSVGGGVMVDLAAKDGARALILESTFTSMPDVAQHHYPWLPVRLLMRNRYDSAAKIADYHGPLLQSHGTSDGIVPYQLGRDLFDRANQPKQFFDIPDGGHNNPQPADYYQTLGRFINELPAAGQ